MDVKDQVISYHSDTSFDEATITDLWKNEALVPENEEYYACFHLVPSILADWSFRVNDAIVIERVFYKMVNEHFALSVFAPVFDVEEGSYTEKGGMWRFFMDVLEVPPNERRRDKDRYAEEAGLVEDMGDPIRAGMPDAGRFRRAPKMTKVKIVEIVEPKQVKLF